MTDDLDTLRREIAEALGWRVEFLSDSYGPGIQYGYWCLKMPDGEFPPIEGTEDYGYGWGDDTEAAAWNRTPDWPRDTDAALALPMGSVELVITIYTEARRGFVVLHAENNEFCVKAENVNEIAEAVARAWLAWRRAGEG